MNTTFISDCSSKKGSEKEKKKPTGNIGSQKRAKLHSFRVQKGQLNFVLNKTWDSHRQGR